MTDGQQLARAALQCVGTPFRLHGRDPMHSLDCVGLLVASLKSCGFPASDPAGYGLRNKSVSRHLEHLGLSQFSLVTGPAECGDVLLVKPGPGQHHILICDGFGGFIHAHAGLRRVVHSPGPAGWPILGHYRISNSNQG